MLLERLSREHRNIEMLLAVLERELEIFDRGRRPDYDVIRAIISYFELYPEVYHHPQEDLVFAKLKTSKPPRGCKGRKPRTRAPRRGRAFAPRSSSGRRCPAGSGNTATKCRQRGSRFHRAPTASHHDGRS